MSDHLEQRSLEALLVQSMLEAQNKSDASMSCINTGLSPEGKSSNTLPAQLQRDSKVNMNHFFRTAREEDYVHDINTGEKMKKQVEDYTILENRLLHEQLTHMKNAPGGMHFQNEVNLGAFALLNREEEHRRRLLEEYDNSSQQQALAGTKATLPASNDFLSLLKNSYDALRMNRSSSSSLPFPQELRTPSSEFQGGLVANSMSFDNRNHHVVAQGSTAIEQESGGLSTVRMSPSVLGLSTAAASASASIVNNSNVLLSNNISFGSAPRPQQAASPFLGSTMRPTAGILGAIQTEDLNSGFFPLSNAPTNTFSSTSTSGVGDIKKKAGKKQQETSKKPKRPLSAYNIFFKHERERILESLSKGNEDKKDEDDKTTPRNQESNMTPGPRADGARSVFDLLASDLEVQNFLNAYSMTKVKKKKPKKKPHGKISFEKLAKTIGERWSQLSAEEHAVYKKMADEDMKRYKKENNLYLKRAAYVHFESKNMLQNNHQTPSQTSLLGNSPLNIASPFSNDQATSILNGNTQLYLALQAQQEQLQQFQRAEQLSLHNQYLETMQKLSRVRQQQHQELLRMDLKRSGSQSPPKNDDPDLHHTSKKPRT